MGRRYRPFDPFEGEFEPPSIRELKIPRPPRRFWFGLGLIGLVLLILLVANPIVGFLTELSWYRGLGLDQVYLTRVGIQLGLFAGGLVIAFAYTGLNLVIALRLRSGPALRALGIRGRRYVWTAAGAAGLAATILISLILAGAASSLWQLVVLYQHQSPSKYSDPVLGMNASFYLLALPLLNAAAGWALGLTFLTTLIVAGLYTWKGESFDLHLTPRAIGHLSALLGMLALVEAAQSWLSRYNLLYAKYGFVWGPGYTGVNARLGLRTVAAVVALILALALFANLNLRRLWLPGAAVGAWIVMGLAGGLYPAAVQRLVVSPAELSQEQPYIKNEIAGTRQAYGLDRVSTKDYNFGPQLTSKAVGDDQVTIDNLRLWDHRPLLDTYEQLQTIRTYYTFNDIDLDRYNIGGRYQQLELSARELDTDKLPSQTGGTSWVNQHLIYTHGYGLAASPVSAVVGEGVPDYVAGDLPPTGPLAVTRPEIYFGERADSYVLAPSRQQEFDYPKGGDNVFASYSGKHGASLDGFGRLLWSLRTGDFNLLISAEVQPRTQLLYRRKIADRVGEIAPFLTLDHDPYVVAVNGHLYWIVDAYTTAGTYPYSEPLSDPSGINYMRNSVKAVVDAYEGTVDFYVADPQDPLIKAYQSAFPTLFKPISAMPAPLRAHIRYPEDLFKVQSSIYTSFHVSDARVFYNREDVWAFPTEQLGPGTSPNTIDPYYVMMRLPEQAQAEYLLILPFVPNNKQNMISWLAVRNDGDHYGELVTYQLPKDRIVFGPQQIANRIQNTPEISRDFSLLNQAGSRIIQGNLLVVPVGNSFLYFEPIYLTATSTKSLPEFKKVILADAEKVVYRDTLKQALDALVGQETAPGPSPGPSPPGLPATVAQLVKDALDHYNRGQDHLKAGDLAGYAQEMAEVARILQQISQQTSGTLPSPGASTTPSPGTSARPSPTASVSPSVSPRPSP